MLVLLYISTFHVNQVKRQRVKQLVDELQKSFVRQLESLAPEDKTFQKIEWLRDGGKHGGGNRFELYESDIFNRASVNVRNESSL